MVGRSLTRRLEHLEIRSLPVVGEPTIIIECVDSDRNVVGRKEITVNAPPLNEPSPAGATMAPTDLARNPRQRLRAVLCRMRRTLCLETSKFRRTLSADGFLTEKVKLDGTCRRRNSAVNSNESNTCWSGGTGRRTGLKIPRSSLSMWVRPPPPAHLN